MTAEKPILFAKARTRLNERKLLAQLQKQAPDLAAAVKAGRRDLHAAVIDANIRQLPEDTDARR